MKALELCEGKPTIEGRYVAYVRCQSPQIRDFTCPVIMTWQAGKWHDLYGVDDVLGWIGPLAVLKASDFTQRVPFPAPAFDL